MRLTPKQASGSITSQGNLWGLIDTHTLQIQQEWHAKAKNDTLLIEQHRDVKAEYLMKYLQKKWMSKDHKPPRHRIYMTRLKIYYHVLADET